MKSSVLESLKHLAEVDGPRAAAFDADGTLWHGDVSEDFIRWMIERDGFGSAATDPESWARYEAVNAQDPAAGCVHILEFYRGLDPEVVAVRIEEFWNQAPERRWIPQAVEALAWLREQGFEIHVVSGTPTPVLLPLPDRLPVPTRIGAASPVSVIALDLEVDADGRYTGRPGGIVTSGPGKVQCLSARVTAPLWFAAGNSALDLDLLRASRGMRWAVGPDVALRRVAEEEGWMITNAEDLPS